MKKVLTEPLVHFLLLGAALFGVYAIASRGEGRGPQQIVVSRQQVESLSAGFARAWQRPPTDRELGGLVDEYVREEVLCREAQALGLDQGDTVVRRRLRQKMEFIADDVAAAREPTDADLQAYFDAHEDAYLPEQRLSFTQIYFNPARRGAATGDAANQALAALNADGAQVNVDDLGDPSLLERNFSDAAADVVAKTFGPSFARALAQAGTGKWAGPIASGYGLHVVLVRERVDSGRPTLAEVRDAVQRDWANAVRIDANEKFFASLRAKYEVSIERADPAAAVVATIAPLPVPSVLPAGGEAAR